MGRRSHWHVPLLGTPVPFFVVGCAAAPVDMPLDRDGDGLMDAEEAGLGTDPQVADSDGDTYDDGSEFNGNSDPLDPTDHPYAGGWPIDACRHDVHGTGYSEGDVGMDFTLQDQYGEDVTLSDFCGKELVIESAAYW